MDAKSILNQVFDLHYEIMVKREQISAIHDSIMSLLLRIVQMVRIVTAFSGGNPG